MNKVNIDPKAPSVTSSSDCQLERLEEKSDVTPEAETTTTYQVVEEGSISLEGNDWPVTYFGQNLGEDNAPDVNIESNVTIVTSSFDRQLERLEELRAACHRGEHDYPETIIDQDVESIKIRQECGTKYGPYRFAYSKYMVMALIHTAVPYIVGKGNILIVKCDPIMEMDLRWQAADFEETAVYQSIQAREGK